MALKFYNIFLLNLKLSLKYIFQELILCLNRIKVTRIWNMHELIYFFHDLQRKEETRKSTSVIIIDSLPSLMLQHHGEKSKESNYTFFIIYLQNFQTYLF